MSNIDPEVQKIFDNYFDLFGTDGWKQFIGDLAASLGQDQRTAASRCDTPEKWLEERGAQIKTLKILNFETMIRNQYDDMVIAVADTTDTDGEVE